MPPQPPTRNAAPAVSTAPVQAPTGTTDTVTPAPPNERSRIVKAISLIDENGATPTSIRNLVGEYYRFVGGRMNYPDMPVTLHQHPLHPNNCDRLFMTLGAGIVFHIGTTIKAFQEYNQLAGETNLTEPFKLKVSLRYDTLIERLERLEALALAWPKVRQTGDIATGFYLEKA